MPRSDLLALSGDDLAQLGTRGWVNAARKELDDGRATGQLTETPEGAVAVSWSDGRVSEVPAGAALGAGRCSCNEGRLCKHLIRLVLLYQRQEQQPAALPQGPWDPGGIGDDVLARQCRPQTLTRARDLFAAGVLAELVRAAQPVARFHLPVCTVRFLLPDQPAYARCNCARPAPCEHVALAVWAFRCLAAGQRCGIVATGAPANPVPPALHDALQGALLDFAEQGVSGAGKNGLDRLARLAGQCEEADLIWPAEVLREWLAQLEAYTAHDARFDPSRVASLVGELAIRLDALHGNTGALPPLLICGHSGDRPAELEPGEYWGLGCGVRRGRRGVELAAYLHDRKSSNVLAITQEVVETAGPAQDERPSFGRLAERSAVHGLVGATFGAVAGGILKLPGGRRTARCDLLPGRAQKGRPGPVLLAQDRLAWEEIDPPVRMDDFRGLEAHLSLLPPSALRPRRLAEDFHVVRVAGVENVRFDPAAQAVQAVLVDAEGGRALLEHPYTSRGRAGVEALLARLGHGPGQLCFVAGQVSRSATLVIRPMCLVWQEEGRRTALQPWAERGTTASDAPSAEPPAAGDATAEYLEHLQQELGELLVLGLLRADGTASRWSERARRGESVGFVRIGARVQALADRLEQKAHTLHWEARAAAGLVLELAVLARLARDLGA